MMNDELWRYVCTGTGMGIDAISVALVQLVLVEVISIRISNLVSV